MSEWPDPSATPLDRARTIARTYRNALVRANPQQAGLLDDSARSVGEAWVCGVNTGTQLCTVSEAALMLGLTPGRVRQLVGAGRIPSAGRTTTGHVLQVDDVLEYQRRARGARPANALSSRASGGSVSTPRQSGQS